MAHGPHVLPGNCRYPEQVVGAVADPGAWSDAPLRAVRVEHQGLPVEVDRRSNRPHIEGRKRIYIVELAIQSMTVSQAPLDAVPMQDPVMSHRPCVVWSNRFYGT